MLNKILNILRKHSGYYEIENKYNKYKELYLQCDKDFVNLMENYENLSAKHESKILEYDIIKHQFEEMLYPYYIKDNSVQKNFKSQQILSCS
jgi:hypothetical protein